MTFPEYYKAQESASPRAKQVQMACTAPLTYKGQAALKTDLDNLKAALKGVDVADVFVPCISPANIEDWNENKYYKTDEEYLFAIADAMSIEYQAIVDAGFLVQVDDPRLVSYYLMDPTSRSTTSASGRRSGSRRSIMRCAASRPRKSAITPATASTWARACMTWRSSTSSTS